MKKEVAIDDHKIPLDEVIERYQTNIQEGLSSSQAQAMLEKNGPNALTPPAETPAWLKFAKLLFGGFSGLLWVSFKDKKTIIRNVKLFNRSLLYFVSLLMELESLQIQQHQKITYGWLLR